MNNPFQIKLLCFGPSQWPLLRSGNEILVAHAAPEMLKTGDIVVYDRQGSRVCHRIISRRGLGLTSEWLIKGDANFRADGWIPYPQILGKVIRVGRVHVGDPFFAIPSRLLFFHSRLQYEIHRAIFESRLGRQIGLLKYKIYQPPIFSDLFARLSAPWLSLKNGWAAIPEIPSKMKPGRFLRPPDAVGFRLRPHGLDYGHALRYEDLFCRDDGAVENLVPLCRDVKIGVLDIGGGAGRLSLALASAGIPTVLVDNSASMLNIASRRRHGLSPSAMSKMEIFEQDIRIMRLGHKFDKLISLNNGLEHLGPERQIVQTLLRLREHAVPSAEALIDVHNLPYWEKHRFEWKKGRWTQIQKIPLSYRRMRYLWERTSPGRDRNEVVWEHAISTLRLRYRLLKTAIRLFPAETWKGWFDSTGWSVVSKWGTWARTPEGPEHPKLIFQLRAT